jgi:Domain of unknown function (DUF4113)
MSQSTPTRFLTDSLITLKSQLEQALAEANTKASHFREQLSHVNALLDLTLDAINAKLGRGTIQFAAAGLKKPWAMKGEMRSPRYTTVWSEIPVVRA